MCNSSCIHPSRRTVLGGIAASLIILPRLAHAASQGVWLTAAALRGQSGPSLGYNGASPGPVLRTRQGQPLPVRLTNLLDEPTNLHWHGLGVSNLRRGADGFSAEVAEPGGDIAYTLPATRAGAFLYYPDRIGEDGRQRDQGLVGVLIIDELQPPPVDHDVALLLDDWDEPGGLRFTINMKTQETLSLRAGERARVRLFNAARTRVATLAVAGVSAQLIALDGNPVNAPFAPQDGRLDLPPGGRAELMIDADAAPGTEAGIGMVQAGMAATILKIVIAAGAGKPPDPQPLTGGPLPADFRLNEARRVTLKLTETADGRRALSGRPADGLASAPAFTLKPQKLCVLALTNTSGHDYGVHVDGQFMRVLYPLDDGWHPYWVNSVIVKAGQTVQVAFSPRAGDWKIGWQKLDAASPEAFCIFSVA